MRCASGPPLAALLLAALPLVVSAAEPITLLVEGAGARREVEVVARGGSDLVALESILQGLGVSFRPDPRKGALTLAYGGREVTIYNGKNLALVQGDLRLMPAAAVSEGGRWLVPVDALPRLLGPLLGKPVDWRAGVRALVLGNVALPRVTLTWTTRGDGARLVFEAPRRLDFQVNQTPGRVTVSVPGEILDFGFQQERLTGGVVDTVRVMGGRDNTVEVVVGPRYRGVTAAEQASPPGLALDFQATAVAVGPSPSPGSSPAPPVQAIQALGAPAVIVIDPGHGGAEVGARGPGGSLEKDITLEIARRLKAILANTVGAQVFLTRDADREVALDERTAFANNFKADVFVSIHANASRAHSAKGSEVYFLSSESTDDESRRIALLESGESGGESRVAPSSDLALILWDMAQASHLAQSSVLASRVHDELADVTGSEGRGVKQAPFRVLVGAAMPAVLVELAFISNAEEEKLLRSDPYQSRVTGALARGITRFLHERGGSSAPTAAGF